MGVPCDCEPVCVSPSGSARSARRTAARWATQLRLGAAAGACGWRAAGLSVTVVVCRCPVVLCTALAFADPVTGRCRSICVDLVLRFDDLRIVILGGRVDRTDPYPCTSVWTRRATADAMPLAGCRKAAMPPFSLAPHPRHAHGHMHACAPQPPTEQRESCRTRLRPGGGARTRTPLRAGPRSTHSRLLGACLTRAPAARVDVGCSPRHTGARFISHAPRSHMAYTPHEAKAERLRAPARRLCRYTRVSRQRRPRRHTVSHRSFCTPAAASAGDRAG